MGFCWNNHLHCLRRVCVAGPFESPVHSTEVAKQPKKNNQKKKMFPLMPVTLGFLSWRRPTPGTVVEQITVRNDYMGPAA